MTLAKDFAAKFAVAIVAVAMVFAAYAPAANAQSSEDLQQMINDLLAQVATLQGQLGGDGSSMAPAGVCPYTWTRDLSQGSTGMDVMKLQQFLNADADTRVAVSGAGSAGMETEYYGPATAAAVSKFQVKYRSEVLSPINLVNPTGYFGSGSRAKANDLCVTPAPTTPDNGDEDEDMDEDEDDNDDEEDFELGGSANLDTFEIDDAEDDDVEEGDEDAEIGMFTVEFENGDAEISRIDVALLASGEDDTDTSEPWEAFETVSLWVDGDKIGEVNADDEDDYIDEDSGELRFSDLELIAEEDEEIEIIVAATVQGNLDAEELGNWNLFATEMRFFDADGVATTEDSFDDIEAVDNDMSNNPSAMFTVEEEGAGDEFDVRTSSEDPEATTLPLEDDENTEYVSFAFDFDAEDSDSDIEVNSFTLDVDATEPDGTTATSAALLIDDIVVMVDGDEVDTDDVTINSGTIEVEFDNEFYVDGGEEVTVEIEVEYKSLAAALEGATVQFSIDGANVDAEGADDVTVGGAATGDEHTLRTEGVILDYDEDEEDFSLKTNSDGTASDDEGVYTIKFDVTAFEEDFFFNKTAARGTTTDDTAGVEYLMESGGDVVTTGTTTQSLTSNAQTEGSRYVVREGETKTFTLKVNYDPATTDFYAVQLNNVNYYTVSSGGTATMQAAIPAEDFESDEYSI